MYLNFFQFTDEPFHITPDPDFLFLTPSHKEALGAIVYGVEQRKGFVCVSGEVGTGKTTIIKAALKRISRERTHVVVLFNVNVTFAELLAMMLDELGVETRKDVISMTRSLQDFLIKEYAAGKNTVLIIDEAQNMPMDTLERLRLLSNIETAKDKLLQIVLVGQPELIESLNHNDLRQLRQRMFNRVTIQPLSREESISYMLHRLSLVTALVDTVFTKQALDLIAKHGKGIPRILNNLCANVLVTAYAAQEKPISRQMVKKVLVDFEPSARLYLLGWRAAGMAVFLLLTTVGLAVFSDVNSMFFAEPPEVSLRDSVSVMTNGDKAEALPEAKNSLNTADQIPEKPITVLPIINASLYKVPHEVEQPMTAMTENKTNSFPVVRVVQKGDILSALCMEVYGPWGLRFAEWVKKNNPHLRNMNQLEVGTRLVFPAPPAAKAAQTGKMTYKSGG